MKNGIAQITLIVLSFCLQTSVLSATALAPAGCEGSSSPQVSPPYWWTGMAESHLELMISAPSVASMQAEVTGKGVQVLRSERSVHPDYLFLHLWISPDAPAQTLELNFQGGGKTLRSDYELKAHSSMAKGGSGLTQRDLIYLIFPDRFANGNPENDRIEGMNDQSLDRSEMFHRHGGDIEGIINHLDYLEDLGVTALWINPLIENDQPKESYHGYAATDLYRIDPRFGDEASYRRLIEACHARGIKVIKDIVYNHWGDQHPLYREMPDSSWFNFWPTFQRTSYRAPTLLDPHANEADRLIMTDGWFDHHMPDLNQKNPHLANYLIQHSLWWVGHYGVDAFRIDTYAYPDQLFMAELGQRIKREFPNFFCFGETWVHGTPIQAWFTEGNSIAKPFDSALEGVTDFQVYYAIQKAIQEPFGWTEGVSRLYYTLAKDALYHRPENNVLFLDNHDLSRIASLLDENPQKIEMALALLMTLRGIPSIYYGTEICMANFADPDGKVREDFPGGWANDSANKFLASGRQAEEERRFQFVRTLAQYRKSEGDIFEGSLEQFVPDKGVYAYLRKGKNKTLLCIYHPEGIGANSSHMINLERYSSHISGESKGVNILNTDTYDRYQQIALPESGFLLLEWSH